MSDQCGLTLQVPARRAKSNPADPGLDIIFVHGLGGSSANGWSRRENSPTSSEFWPPASLSLSSASFWLFLWDSRRILEQENALSEFTDRLLTALEKQRGPDTQASAKLLNVSPLAQQLHQIATISKQPVATINREAVISIHNVLQEFLSLSLSGLKWKVISFFEELSHPRAPVNFGPIVGSKDTYLKGQIQIGLHADHQTGQSICRLGNPQTPAYQAIEAAIRGLDTHTPNPAFRSGLHAISQRELDIINSLNVVERLGNGAVATAGTCSWIFDHSNFRSWLDESSSLLWIKGKPGSGKSTLMRFLSEKRALKDTAFTLFSHFALDDPTRKSPKSMLMSLLHQLLVTTPRSLPFGMLQEYSDKSELLGNYGTYWEWHEEELKKYLHQSIRQASQSGQSLVFFLDALDECDDPGTICSFTRDILTFRNVHVCISSRLDPQCDAFNIRKISLEEYNTTDIKSWISTRLSSLELYKATVKESLVQKIAQEANGVFIWAKLAISNLDVLTHPSATAREIVDGLMLFPKSLNQLYDLILGRLLHRSRNSRRLFATILLQWVMCAQRPLTTSELLDALSSQWPRCSDVCSCFPRTRETCIPPRPSKSVQYHFMDTITWSCGGFIEIESHLPSAPAQYDSDWASSRVKFVHRSVREFLLKRGPELIGNDTFHWNGHQHLARVCLDFLSEEPHEFKENGQNILSWRPFTEYAVIYGLDHLRLAETFGAGCSDLIITLASDTAIDRWIVWHNLVAQDNQMFQPGKSTFYHVFSYFNIPFPDQCFHDIPGHGIGSRDHAGRTPLSLAATMGHESICFQLIEFGVDVDTRDDIYGQTPLGWASAYGHSGVVKLLLEAGAAVDDYESGCTPLHLAIRYGRFESSRLLLEKGADVNKRDTRNGQTALALAAGLGKGSLVPLLLEHESDALKADQHTGWTPLHWAVFGGHHRTLERLIGAISDIGVEKLKRLTAPATSPAWVHKVLVGLLCRKCCNGSGECTSGTPGETHQRNDQNSTSNGSGGNNQKKRPRGDTIDNSDEEEDKSSEQPSRKQARHSDSRRWACPYYKRSPEKYGNKKACVGPGFPDIHRLKQHLLKCHFRGKTMTRCWTCKQSFSHNEIKSHGTSKLCQPQPEVTDYEDGFDAIQHQQLKSGDMMPKHFTTMIQHWNRIFMIVFPDWRHDIPTPYYEDTETCPLKDILAVIQSSPVIEGIRQRADSPENLRNFLGSSIEAFIAERRIALDTASPVMRTQKVANSEGNSRRLESPPHSPKEAAEQQQQMLAVHHDLCQSIRGDQNPRTYRTLPDVLPFDRNPALSSSMSLSAFSGSIADAGSEGGSWSNPNFTDNTSLSSNSFQMGQLSAFSDLSNHFGSLTNAQIGNGFMDPFSAPGLFSGRNVNEFVAELFDQGPHTPLSGLVNFMDNSSTAAYLSDQPTEAGGLHDMGESLLYSTSSPVPNQGTANFTFQLEAIDRGFQRPSAIHQSRVPTAKDQEQADTAQPDDH
ncbi:hypothetical protein FDECE_8920 [Fusarium decemcellulare]|nr:hypothetical protein FDECE_8920 [Fusarium decemcellulare]